MEQKPSLQARSDGVSIDTGDRLRDQSRDYFHRFMPVTCHVALADSGHVLSAQGKLSFRVRRASFVPLLPPAGQSAFAGYAIGDNKRRGSPNGSDPSFTPGIENLER